MGRMAPRRILRVATAPRERFPLTLQALGSLGEFVGGVVVMLSIIYLARQVHQNTDSLRTENYTRALDRLAAIQSRFGGDPMLINIFGRGVLSTAQLTPEERIRFTWAFYEMFGAFEFMFHQVQRRALPEEVWARWSAALAWWLSFPGVRSWWESKPTPFTESFSSLVDAYIAENPYDRQAAKRWQEFLQQKVAAPQGRPPPA